MSSKIQHLPAFSATANSQTTETSTLKIDKRMTNLVNYYKNIARKNLNKTYHHTKAESY